MRRMENVVASTLAATAVVAVVFIIVSTGRSSGTEAQSGVKGPNGFDVSYSIIPTDQIFGGGPSRDGIPALTDPKVLKAVKAEYLRAEDIVIGVSFDGESRAYPLRIVVWHENVNDTVGGVPIAVSYCPLCRSALVFDRRIGGSTREFGISGLLWNSNVLLYDRRKDRGEESLWSQVHMRAVTGPAAREGLHLRLLPAELTSWKEWLERHPNTTALSKRTGYYRNYDVMPYSTYFSNDRLMFPVRQQKKRPERFMNKEPMIIVSVGDKWKAYAVRDVEAVAGKSGSIEDMVGGKRLRFHYSKESAGVHAELVEDGSEVPAAYMFWFALSSMLPEVEVYEPPSAY